MLRGLLAAAVAAALAAGRLPPAAVAAVAAAAFALLYLPLHRGHDHDNWTAIDYYAHQSRLHSVPAGLKGLLALGMIVLVLAASSPAVSLAALALAFGWTLLGGRTPAGTLLRLYAVPLAFVLLSAVALLLDFAPSPAGAAVAVPCFGRYLVVTAEAQAETLQILLGAAAAVSWLYALCLSTPLAGLIGALGRLRVPEILIELMYLIYRYIFVLSGTFVQLRTAAVTRLGTASARASLRSAGWMMTSLLTASFRKASASFDAMQARGCAGRIRFLEERPPLRAGHVLAAAATLAAAAAVIPLERMWRG